MFRPFNSSQSTNKKTQDTKKTEEASLDMSKSHKVGRTTSTATKVAFATATNNLSPKVLDCPLTMEPRCSKQGQTLRDYFQDNPPSILKYFEEIPPPSDAEEFDRDEKDQAQQKAPETTASHSKATEAITSTFKKMNVRASNTGESTPCVIKERATLSQLFEECDQPEVDYATTVFTPDAEENMQGLGVEMSVEDEYVRCFWQEPLADNNETPIRTMPGLMTERELLDRIGGSVLSHLGAEELSKRHLLTADCVSQGKEGLLKLIEKRCYRAAINLCGRLLTKYGQGYGRMNHPTKHSPLSVQLWFTRLSLLAKVGELEILQAEAKPFQQLSNPDMFYDNYPNKYTQQTGSMACFSFRILVAELPIHSGSPLQALNNLSALFVLTGEIKKYFKDSGADSAATFWRKREIRILHSIINCALMLKMFNLIDDFMNEMLVSSNDLTKDERRALFSTWGRIYLQNGDIFGAEQKFSESRRLRESQTVDLRDLVDKGLVQVAKNDFPGAFASFQKALQLDSSNLMILNNMGVCLLYAGKLKDAINLFERSINRDPRKMLHESLLVNLSTLYELESPDPLSKKLSLLRLVNKFTPDLGMSPEGCISDDIVGSILKNRGILQYILSLRQIIMPINRTKY